MTEYFCTLLYENNWAVMGFNGYHFMAEERKIVSDPHLSTAEGMRGNRNLKTVFIVFAFAADQIENWIGGQTDLLLGALTIRLLKEEIESSLRNGIVGSATKKYNALILGDDEVRLRCGLSFIPKVIVIL